MADHVKGDMVIARIATTDGKNFIPSFSILTAMAAWAELGSNKWQRGRVLDVPAIYILAVAIRECMRCKHLGTALVIDAMDRCLGIVDQMDAAAVVLDVLDGEHFDRRWKF